ncbi:MAG: IS200/IS605 family transposase [Planctomycetaceae bacterium]|nr:IS200/IS605 family transposase [Planctomycetaceae bacterium]
MPQSPAKIYLHIVFSTKNRRPFLQTPEVRGAMTGYLIGILNNLDCLSICTGVVEDHVHILCTLSRTITVAKLIEEVKGSSSQRIKEDGPNLTEFSWQRGYSVFSVSQSGLEQVAHYVATQEDHHRKMSFQDELRTLLRRYEVDFDERYVGD